VTDADAFFFPLAADAVPAVSRLAARCLAADGGLPLAAGEGFTGRRYAAEGGLAIGAYDDGVLVAAAAIRPTGDTATGTALVDPASRGRRPRNTGSRAGRAGTPPPWPCARCATI
jgi:hypothetical protein